MTLDCQYPLPILPQPYTATAASSGETIHIRSQPLVLCGSMHLVRRVRPCWPCLSGVSTQANCCRTRDTARAVAALRYVLVVIAKALTVVVTRAPSSLESFLGFAQKPGRPMRLCRVVSRVVVNNPYQV